MLGIRDFPAFLLAILIFQAVPGPGTLAILKASAAGRRAGLTTVLGTLSGDAVYMFAAAVGLAAFVSARPMILNGLQWFGVAYLCWLGLKLLLGKKHSAGNGAASEVGHRQYFRRAFVISLTNPKVMLFFVAFFPLFMRPEAGALTLLAMALIVTFTSGLYQSLLVLIGSGVPLSR